ncbi:hypothetical protein [uncultured Caulobacter sp.]|uniref:hypothetical protein n=1 Tax=uncultured Caulobacter sp. TaxID=158749 RepID=UPI002608AD12|nr:hypothetical protein [uncultured Caulobacter sp.]
MNWNKVVFAGLLLGLALTSAPVRAEVVYKFTREKGLYDGPMAVLNTAQWDESRFKSPQDNLYASVRMDKWSLFAFGCEQKTGKIYYYRDSFPALGNIGLRYWANTTWTKIDDNAFILEGEQGSPEADLIWKLMVDVYQTKRIFVGGLQEQVTDPDDAIGEVGRCASDRPK